MIVISHITLFFLLDLENSILSPNKNAIWRFFTFACDIHKTGMFVNIRKVGMSEFTGIPNLNLFEFE